MSILEREKEIKEFLKNIVKEHNLDGILLVDMEGLPLVSYVDESIDEDTVSASSAAIVSATMIAASDTQKRGVNGIMIDTEDGYLVFTPINEEYILTVLTPPGAKLGIIRLITNKVEEFIESILGQKEGKK
ncbi:roadblock/LC7 domain-containing protein [Aquifex sp.]